MNTLDFLTHNYEIGEYLFLAMGNCNDHKVVMAVGYKPQYAYKKVLQFQDNADEVEFEDISVIKVGELTKCHTIFERDLVEISD